MEDRKLTMKLFDKRDDFPFSIVRMPFATSNMPSTMFYSSVGAEILRICRVSSTTFDFNASAKTLISRVCKQGAKNDRLVRTLKKMYGRHDALRRFGTNASGFVKSLFD